MAAATKKKNVDAAGRRKKAPNEPVFANRVDAEPTSMQEFYAEWLEEKTGYKVDLRSTILASVLRAEFQKSPENQARLAENAERREQEEAEREERRAARAERKAEREAAAKEKKAATAKKAAPAKKAPAAKPAPKAKPAAKKPAAKASTKPAPRRRPAKSDDDF